MQITKYNQSCLLIESKGIRILVDPGKFGYNDDRLNKEWINVDAILITHKHDDHCLKEAIEAIINRDGSNLYLTNEVQNTYHFDKANIIKEKDIFDINNIKVEVVHAMHGYLTGMHERNGEVLENVGYIIDDGNTKLYTTSDTINFYNDYKCDILCMPFNGNGLTMGIIDGLGFAKAINPKLLLPIHMEHPLHYMNPNLETLSQAIESIDLKYKILNVGERIEV